MLPRPTTAAHNATARPLRVALSIVSSLPVLSFGVLLLVDATLPMTLCNTTHMMAKRYDENK